MDMDDSSITGVKNVTMNEPFFQGHFPNNPVMPGVLQVEDHGTGRWDCPFHRGRPRALLDLLHEDRRGQVQEESPSGRHRAVLAWFFAFAAIGQHERPRIRAGNWCPKLKCWPKSSGTACQTNPNDPRICQRLSPRPRRCVCAPWRWGGCRSLCVCRTQRLCGRRHLDWSQRNVLGNTTVGRTPSFPGCGGADSQDLKYNGEPTTVEIGDRTSIRASPSTVHHETAFRVRSDSSWPTCASPDVQVGNHVILANACNVAGRVIEDQVIIGTWWASSNLCASAARLRAGVRWSAKTVRRTSRPRVNLELHRNQWHRPAPKRV